MSWIILATTISSTGAQTQCKEPSDLSDIIKRELSDSIGNGRTLDLSFYLIPGVQKILSNTYYHKNASKVKSTTLYGDKTCPRELDSSRPHNMHRSTCPWFVEMTADEGRIPRLMARARCSCRNCVMKSDINKTKSSRVLQYKCKPILSYVRVLRQVACQDGVKQYKGATEEVAVGCACVVPKDGRPKQR